MSDLLDSRMTWNVTATEFYSINCWENNQGKQEFMVPAKELELFSLSTNSRYEPYTGFRYNSPVYGIRGRGRLALRL